MNRAAGIGLLLVAVAMAWVSRLPAAEPPTRSVRLGSDVFAAGGSVQLTQAVAGDALIAGNELDSTSAIGGDLAAAGSQLHIAGTVGGDLYGAGRRIELQGSVRDNARLAGDELVIGRDARIGGGASLAARRVEFDGSAAAYLSIASAATRIDGAVGGDVQVAGRELALGPHAQIAGRLTFRGAQPPNLAPGARVSGGVQFIPQRGARRARYAGVLRAGSWAWLIGWMIAGAVLLAVWPLFTRAASNATAERIPHALGVGLLVLLLIPVAIGLLFITVLGIPLALLLLAAYLLLLPLGYLTAAIAIGDRILLRMRGAGAGRGQRALILAATLLALFIIRRVPFFGAVVSLLVLLAGLGGLVLAAARTLAAGTTSTAA